MYNTYLVRADSPLRSVEDADRDGVTVAAVRAQTQEIYLSANLKRARVKIVESQPSQTELERVLASREVDAIAQNTQRAAEAVAAAGTRVPLRALTGSYVAVEQSFVVKKGDTANAAMLDRFVDELRASGFIRTSLDRRALVQRGRRAGAAAMSADDAADPDLISRRALLGRVSAAGALAALPEMLAPAAGSAAAQTATARSFASRSKR